MPMDDIYVNFLPNMYGSIGVNYISCGNISRVKLFFPQNEASPGDKTPGYILLAMCS